MSAEHDVHAESESEDGGVSLTKVDSDEMDIEGESDTTHVSQDSGESSSSSANAWGETMPLSFEGYTEHGDLTAENAHISGTFNEDLQSSMVPPFGELQAALSTLSTPFSEWPHNVETNFAFSHADFGTLDQVSDLDSSNEDSHEELPDQSNGLPNDLLLPDEIQAPASLTLISWSAPLLADNVTSIEPSEPPVGTSEDEAAQETGQDVLDGPPISDGIGNTTGSDEDWLALSEDSYNIFSTDITHVNGTLHTLNQASNMASFIDHDDFEEEESSLLSVSYFLHHWKQMYTNRKPDYPCISQLANKPAQIRRPAKITKMNNEQCDYQGIYWSRFQTTKQDAREVRRMTYRNLRSVGLVEQNFGTKAFKADFPGAIIPNCDLYFGFNEMDTNRRPDYSHFQLRHNLSATSKNAIFYTHRPPRPEGGSHLDVWRLQYKRIVCFNPETGTELCVMDVNKRHTKEDPKISKIHTLTAGNGLLVAGSFEGVYAMKSLSADYESAPTRGVIAVGNDVSTNHIHTHLDRQSGLPRVVFDSNDRSVRILDSTTTRWIACHQYPYQVNCSVTSPDGRLRLLNGDDCEPTLANAETGETLARLVGHSDFGFACDWAPDGITMATGHQDGLVKVWDARKLSQSIQTIAMEQAGCRSLQFSPLGSGKRVLVLAEPADFVHIVDAQTFESKQTIDFFGEISGISMPPDGSRLYIANADAKYGGLMEYERSWDSSKYNRRPFRVSDLEDEHEELVDSIVDGVQSPRRLPRPGDKLTRHVEPFMHGQGLPFVPSLIIQEKSIDSNRLMLECLARGGGHEITELGEWATFADTFGIPGEHAVSFGEQLYEYWRDNLAPYEASFPFAQVMSECWRARNAESERVPGSGSNLKARTFLPFRKERQYRRDYQDARRKGFKVGRKSQTLDWLSESDLEDDDKVNFPRGQHVNVDDDDVILRI